MLHPDTINSIMYPFLVHFNKLPDINLAWFTIFNAAWHIRLSAPDPTGILPILTGLITFVQVRMAQPLNVSETKEAMQQASQTMQWITPVLFAGVTIFFAWQFAAGVALYRVVSLLLNIIQQYFISGWGSLWTLPATAMSGNVNMVNASRSVLSDVPQTSTKARKHRGRRVAHRRGKHPKRER